MAKPAPDQKPVTDALPGHWVERMPRGLVPYLRLARLDRPIGTWLLLLPCWWGLALAGPVKDMAVPDLKLMALFALGAIVMRGAGCTYNDIVDRDIDAKVARTRNRPLPSGAVSVQAAVIFLIVQAFAGFLVLLSFNTQTIALGIASLALVALYPFAKRFTYWPQALLGLTFNWGVLLGYTAVTGSVGWAAALLYAAGTNWTLGYDTIYAHQDKEDDALAGVKSSALALGADTKPALIVFYACCIILLGLAGMMGKLGVGFWPGLLAVAVHFGWQIRTLDIDKPESCLAVFRSNRDAGFLIFLALLLGATTA